MSPSEYEDVQEKETHMSSGQHPAVPEQEEQVLLAQRVHIVLAGKSGAGKTTFLRNVFGFKERLETSPDHITTRCFTYHTTKNNIAIKITDTVGLHGNRKELKELYKHTKGKADILVFCIPVDPSSKFDYANPDIMKSLQDALWQGYMEAVYCCLHIQQSHVGSI